VVTPPPDPPFARYALLVPRTLVKFCFLPHFSPCIVKSSPKLGNPARNAVPFSLFLSLLPPVQMRSNPFGLCSFSPPRPVQLAADCYSDVPGCTVLLVFQFPFLPSPWVTFFFLACRSFERIFGTQVFFRVHPFIFPQVLHLIQLSTIPFLPLPLFCFFFGPLQLGASLDRIK